MSYPCGWNKVSPVEWARIESHYSVITDGGSDALPVVVLLSGKPIPKRQGIRQGTWRFKTEENAMHAVDDMIARRKSRAPKVTG